MKDEIHISDFVAGWTSSAFGWLDDRPWHVTQAAEAIVQAAIHDLAADYRVENDIAVHRSATIETGAVLKAPIVVGRGCLVAAGAYLRGGVFLEEDCIVGPGCELKSSFMFRGSKIAHFNFVGDSIMGADVNVEAGGIIANFRNELALDNKAIRVCLGDIVIETGVEKFGALVGDGVRIGANAVVAPGAILPPFTKVARLALVDHHPAAKTSLSERSR